MAVMGDGRPCNVLSGDGKCGMRVVANVMESATLKSFQHRRTLVKL